VNKEMPKTKLLQLKSFRILRELTQDQMAEILGMSKTQYERRENGQISVKSHEITMFAQKFSIPVNAAAKMLIPDLMIEENTDK
jgi:transcriptional regulator with XRE-family HTH domain